MYQSFSSIHQVAYELYVSLWIGYIHQYFQTVRFCSFDTAHNMFFVYFINKIYIYNFIFYYEYHKRFYYYKVILMVTFFVDTFIKFKYKLNAVQDIYGNTTNFIFLTIFEKSR